MEDDDFSLIRCWLGEPRRWHQQDTVRAYERAFAAWNGSRHAYSFKSGRVALSACLHALGLRPGDEVILPAYTCVAVPNAIRFAGLQPVFCDIELESFGMDRRSAETKIGPRTRALLIQHLYGLVSRDYEALLELAARHELPVIEDCAHATGARWKGVRVGVRGRLAFYSSERSKVFSTEQGGMAVSEDGSLADRLAAFQRAAADPDDEWIERVLRSALVDSESERSHPWWRGLSRPAHSRILSLSPSELRGERPATYLGRLPAPLAALGLNQLQKIDDYAIRRRKAALSWDAWCESRGYRGPRVIEGSEPVFLRYPVLVEPERKRDRAWAVEELGLLPGTWFETHLHPAPEPVSGCVAADEAVARCINLPTLRR
jgi:dTDP-4-amino-4,6-dideoxygalactose transaminase